MVIETLRDLAGLNGREVVKVSPNWKEDHAGGMHDPLS